MIIFFIGCDSAQGPSLSDRFNLEIAFNPWLTFDYRSITLKLKFREGDILVDTIRFTLEEDACIKSSFEKNCIALTKGKYWIGSSINYPSDAVVIKVYRDKSVLSFFHYIFKSDGVNNIEKKLQTSIKS